MDARVRELERRAATGDRDAEVALLRERLRTGQTDRQRVRVAAYCGDEVSRVVEPIWIAENSWAEVDELARFAEHWLEGFRVFDREVRVRVALALAELTVEGLDSAACSTGSAAAHLRVRTCRGYLADVRGWLAEPTLGRAEICRQRYVGIPTSRGETTIWPVVWLALSSTFMTPPRWEPARAYAETLRAICGVVATEASSEDWVRWRVAKALLGWALAVPQVGTERR